MPKTSPPAFPANTIPFQATGDSGTDSPLDTSATGASQTGWPLDASRASRRPSEVPRNSLPFAKATPRFTASPPPGVLGRLFFHFKVQLAASMANVVL